LPSFSGTIDAVSAVSAVQRDMRAPVATSLFPRRASARTLAIVIDGIRHEDWHNAGLPLGADREIEILACDTEIFAVAAKPHPQVAMDSDRPVRDDIPEQLGEFLRLEPRAAFHDFMRVEIVVLHSADDERMVSKS
jgi:hypothetical protein